MDCGEEKQESGLWGNRWGESSFLDLFCPLKSSTVISTILFLRTPGFSFPCALISLQSTHQQGANEWPWSIQDYRDSAQYWVPEGNHYCTVSLSLIPSPSLPFSTLVTSFRPHLQISTIFCQQKDELREQKSSKLAWRK